MSGLSTGPRLELFTKEDDKQVLDYDTTGILAGAGEAGLAAIGAGTYLISKKSKKK